MRPRLVMIGVGVIASLAAAAALSSCSPASRPAGAGTTISGNSPGPGQAGSGRAGDSGRAATGQGSAARPAAAVTIAAVGDMMLGNTPDLPAEPAAYFNAVKPVLDSGAQIVFGNLEGTLTTGTDSKCGSLSGPGKVQSGAGQDCFAFRDPPAYARYFKDAGFTVLNDANNHSFDFGAAGQAQTVRAIHAAGLAQTGLPGEITVVRAHRTRVAFLAFAPYSYDAGLLDLSAARALIRRAGREAGVVVVYMHAGAEGSDSDHVTGREEYYLGEDRGNAEMFAHLAIRAGASLVLASGPHVVRGMQFYHGRLIAYSLGNFAGYGNFSMDGDLDDSVILRVRLSSRGRFERARIYPVQFTGEGRPVPGGGAVTFIARLSADDFGAGAARITPSGIIRPP